MGLLPCCPLCGARSIIAVHEHYFVFRRISATPLSAAFDCCSTLPRPLTEPMWGKVGAKWGLMADFRQSPARSEPRDRAKVLGAALVVGPGSASGSVRGGTGARPRQSKRRRKWSAQAARAAALMASSAPERLPPLPRLPDFPDFCQASYFCTNPQMAHRVSPGKCGASDVSK